MTHLQYIHHQLIEIEGILKRHGLWQLNAPEEHAFNSSAPFFLDTMQPQEWLQWVLLPRLLSLIEQDDPLPGNFAIAAYYEVALEDSASEKAELVSSLKRLDELMAWQEK